MKLGQWYHLLPGDSIRIDAVRFYLTQNPNSAQHQAHLVDFAMPYSTHILYPDSSSQWLLGTDSLMNVSGALSGALDPVLGMYWAWHSGYINIKIEGMSMKCPTRNHRFQFHLGGYVAPNATAMPLCISNETSVLEIDLDDFFRSIDLSQTNEVMSPGPLALSLTQAFYSSIQFKP
jgi:hypothetical protein